MAEASELEDNLNKSLTDSNYVFDEIDENIVDQDDDTSDVAPIQYDISSYGADYTVDALVKRLKRGDIFIPDFQRGYVWNQNEASRLIESLLLGLPVPGVFLAKESETNKLLVIDGQQRLKSLLFFCEEFFNPNPNKTTKRSFRLTKVQKKFEGKIYSTLDDSDRLKLDDSIIHATVVKQESPDDDNTSIYHVFERLNTGGRKLTTQEIRSAIYYGSLNNLIVTLNNYPSWRALFGPANARLKDEELILRFLAVYFDSTMYTKPMAEFLHKFNKRRRNPTPDFLNNCKSVFENTMDFLWTTLGRASFRPERTLNVSVMEAVSVGTARLLDKLKSGESIDVNKFKSAHDGLLKDEGFLKATSNATSDENVFKERHSIFEKYFADVL